MTDLTPARVRALSALAKHDELHSREWAKAMWPDSPAWGRSTNRHDGKGGGKGAAMPMKAAAFGYRLASDGLVTYRRPASTTHPVWSITEAGRAALTLCMSSSS